MKRIPRVLLKEGVYIQSQYGAVGKIDSVIKGVVTYTWLNYEPRETSDPNTYEYNISVMQRKFRLGVFRIITREKGEMLMSLNPGNRYPDLSKSPRSFKGPR